jgi:2-dehydro-3-deoxyglucarate aldolase/4-hydroxy-2-oxoheptanedioate aldolase
MAQIETIEGVKNARAIAAVDGVDVLFVGPADLNFDLQSRPGTSTDDYTECLAKVAAAAAEHGKQCGILVRNAADLKSLKEQGFTMLAMDSDLGILRTQYQTILKLKQTND